MHLVYLASGTIITTRLSLETKQERNYSRRGKGKWGNKKMTITCMEQWKILTLVFGDINMIEGYVTLDFHLLTLIK